MIQEEVRKLFEELGGKEINGFSLIDSPVFKSSKGTPFLTKPGVVTLAKPSLNLRGMEGFLAGFDPTLNFSGYLQDPVSLPEGTHLSKVAGQLCYISFGPKRTKNEMAERYFANIKAEKHGSVLEHANYTFLFYGTSRSLTHELVRHRAGFAYSQVSQRYVGGNTLRFVERPEYQSDELLHRMFFQRIDRIAQEYQELTELLIERQKSGLEILRGEARTDLRKKVQQTSRSLLPNETEAPIIVTANVRAWRHFIEMRASEHAETEIRQLAFRVFLCLSLMEPILFSDYRIIELTDDTFALDTLYRKV